MTITASGHVRRSAGSTSMPSPPGIRLSSTIAAGTCSAASRSARPASGAVTTRHRHATCTLDDAATAGCPRRSATSIAQLEVTARSQPSRERAVRSADGWQRRTSLRRAAAAGRARPGRRHRRRSAGNAARVDRAGRRRPTPAHTSCFPGDGADRLPGRGPRAAPLVRRRLPCGARAAAQRTSPTTGSATSPSSSATSTACPDAAPRVGRPAGEPQNAAAVICTAARSSRRYAKHHLPNYGVFDEFRYFVPGDALPVVRLARRRRRARRSARTSGRTAARSPSPRAPGSGCVVRINGSPYERNKDDVRAASSSGAARPRPGAPLAYVNMVGGQDELVFDGDSLVVDADGERARARAAVRRGAARRRPRPAGRDRRTSSEPSTRGTARRCTVDAIDASAPSAAAGVRPAPRRVADGSTTRRGLRGARHRPARLRATRTASGPSCSGCPAASTRRWSRRSRATRSVPTTCTSSAMPSRYSSDSSRRRRRGAGASGSALHWSADADRADGRGLREAFADRSSAACTGSPRRTCRRGCAASS